MGLDIDLYKCPDRAYAQAQEEKFEKKLEEMEGLFDKPYRQWSGDEKEAEGESGHTLVPAGAGHCQGYDQIRAFTA